jgi:DNA repair exonuclease SbcCD ATPase subunit
MKPRTVSPVLFLVIMAVLLCSARCSMFRALGLAQPDFREDFSLLGPDDFPEKIEQLEEIAQTHKREHVRARAVFYIALAHMHYNNPSPDYGKALSYMDAYIVLDSDNKDIDEIVAWKSVLLILDTSLREYEKLERDYAQLQKDYAHLKKDYENVSKDRESLNQQIIDLGQRIEKQKKEISSLEEIIKKLDAVHREIEKKKKIK